MGKDGQIVIEYGTIQNENERAGGWLPLAWINGRRSGHTWSSIGLDREVALESARLEALEEAAKFVGDWDVTVRRRPSGGEDARPSGGHVSPCLCHPSEDTVPEGKAARMRNHPAWR